MKIITNLFSGEIVIENEVVSSLIIEKPDVMYKLIDQLYKSINGEENDIVLSDENTILKISPMGATWVQWVQLRGGKMVVRKTRGTL